MHDYVAKARHDEWLWIEISIMRSLKTFETAMQMAHMIYYFTSFYHSFSSYKIGKNKRKDFVNLTVYEMLTVHSAGRRKALTKT